jgi:serine/threonine protein kinase
MLDEANARLGTSLGNYALKEIIGRGILGQVAQALAAVHARGIVHRDIKPENIMLARRSGKREFVRRVRADRDHVDRVEPEACFDLVTILDFGAARTLQPEFQTAIDQTRIFGTPAYLAPETAMSGHADPRSEVYSVGILFYEMLTGQVPFEGDTAADTVRMQISRPPQPPRQRNPNVEITEEAERVILRALEKDPTRRQASMNELWEDLQRCYGAMRWSRPELAWVSPSQPPAAAHPAQERQIQGRRQPRRRPHAPAGPPRRFGTFDKAH